ncbi:MAG TPA: urea ABC transporter substrate-binding protein, partial [Bryobacteraceae bacterium]|nr:urea ABC transporter substrate-binding protein [Bryobacteraceae bacterium]
MSVNKKDQSRRISRRKLFQDAGKTVLGASAAAVGFNIVSPEALGDNQPIKVGILHSLSGTMAISETSLRDVELMAIGEINAKGGVLGRKVTAIVEDGASDWPNFAEKSKKLLLDDKVCSVFGCWTSASRKAVLPVFERNNGLLWYPVQYEGNECSRNVFYTGACPNQQIEPAVSWLMKNRGKKFYLLGSDYVFPRTANLIIKSQLRSEGGQLVGEEYTPLGHMEYSTVVNKIRAAKPDVVFSTINGDSNVAFYKQFRNAGITAHDIAVMAVSVAEDELRGIGGNVAEGHYAAWNYFQSVNTPENKKFVTEFKRKFGQNRVTDDPIEAAYFQVHLWAQAVQKAGNTSTDAIRKAAAWQSFNAPEGLVKIDGRNNHTLKTVRIGQILPSGQFKIVYASNGPVTPEPYDRVA